MAGAARLLCSGLSECGPGFARLKILWSRFHLEKDEEGEEEVEDEEEKEEEEEEEENEEEEMEEEEKGRARKSKTTNPKRSTTLSEKVT